MLVTSRMTVQSLGNISGLIRIRNTVKICRRKSWKSGREDVWRFSARIMNWCQIKWMNASPAGRLYWWTSARVAGSVCPSYASTEPKDTTQNQPETNTHSTYDIQILTQILQKNQICDVILKHFSCILKVLNKYRKNG